MIMVHRRLGAGCGCDAPDPRTGLIGIEEALTRLVAQIEPVPGTERLGLSDVVGRVLAEPVRALSDMPRFDHSAMDGYAIRRAGLSGNGPWRLPVVLRCAAGHGTLPDLPEGAAAHVFTGAPIPFGADCVVPQEAVRRHADRIEIPLRPPTGANIRTRGEEWSAGNPILPRGTRVTARSVAAAAAAGHAAMIVRRRLRITLLVSGAEIVAPGAPDPRDGTIWDVNTPMLRAALARPDVRIVAMDRIPDDAEGTRVALAEAARVSDLIVTTGGVSVGEEDHLRAAFAEIGGVEIFSGVAMKPETDHLRRSGQGRVARPARNPASGLRDLDPVRNGPGKAAVRARPPGERAASCRSGPRGHAQTGPLRTAGGDAGRHRWSGPRCRGVQRAGPLRSGRRAGRGRWPRPVAGRGRCPARGGAG